MSAVMPFDFEGRAVRVVHDVEGVAWFVALDVCEALAIRNSRDAWRRGPLVSIAPHRAT